MTAATARIIEERPQKRRPAHPTSLEEMRLVKRCVTDDPTAFKELYLKYRTTVFRVVARMISVPADQEEIVQEVFLQVFRSIGTFRGTAKFSTWIQRVTRNVVHQHIRRKQSRIQMVFPAERAEPIWDGYRGEKNHITPEDHAIREDRRGAVSRAMRTLSSKKRLAMLLYDFKGVSVKQISELVGAPVLTVRTRIFYARKEFYNQLEQEPAFSDIPLNVCCTN